MLPMSAFYVLKELTETQAGRLFHAICLYQLTARMSSSCADNDKTLLQDDDLELLRKLDNALRDSHVRVAFACIQPQLDAQLKLKPAKRPTTKNTQTAKDELVKSLEPYIDKYGRDMLNEFYVYWSEPNKSKTRLRYQLESTWDVELRLQRWAKKEKVDKNNNNSGDIIADKQFKEW